MTALLEFREKLRNIYGRFDIYIKPLMKFLLAVCLFSIINGNIGYMQRINSVIMTFVFSLVCCILPVNGMILLVCAVVLLHLYALTLEVAIVGGVLFLFIALLYFRFAPKDGIYAILTPACLFFQMGPVMPLAVGLMGRGCSIISVICGGIVWFFLDGVRKNAAALSGNSEDAAAVSKFTAAFNQFANNKEMYLVLATFLFVAILVLCIRRMSVDYAWTVAILIGAFVNFIVLFAGYLFLAISGRLLSLIIGSLLSLIVAFILEFFFFSLDYSRTERVQFEDNEYYYYVKAVPKMYVAEEEKQVTTFNAKENKKYPKRRLSNRIKY